MIHTQPLPVHVYCACCTLIHRVRMPPSQRPRSQRRRSLGETQHGRRRRAPAIYSPEITAPVRRRAHTERAEKTGGEPSNPLSAVARRVAQHISNIRTSTALLDIYNADGWRGTKCVTRNALSPSSRLF